MPRPRRIAPGGFVYHVLNRATEGQRLFDDVGDYQVFLALLRGVREQIPMRICGFCLMTTHWHLVLWPSSDDTLSAYMHRVETLHALQYRARRGSQGRGHVYQDRFKSFPIETSRYYYNALKYVEANALRAHYVERAEEWPWSSAWERRHGGDLLNGHPLDTPSDWITIVNTVQSDEELKDLRAAASKGRPYGSPAWIGYASTVLSLGRLASRGASQAI